MKENRYIDGLQGICLASLARSLQGGFLDFASASVAAARAARLVPPRSVRTIPYRSLEDVLAGRRPDICLTVEQPEDGALPTDQALILLSVLVAEQPKAVLEIGTFMGHTTKAMAVNLPASIIHTVDLPTDFSPQSDSVQDLPKDDYQLIAKRSLGREFVGTDHRRHIRASR